MGDKEETPEERVTRQQIERFMKNKSKMVTDYDPNIGWKDSIVLEKLLNKHARLQRCGRCIVICLVLIFLWCLILIYWRDLIACADTLLKFVYKLLFIV